MPFRGRFLFLSLQTESMSLIAVLLLVVISTCSITRGERSRRSGGGA
jgi:hypothetical protein